MASTCLFLSLLPSLVCAAAGAEGGGVALFKDDIPISGAASSPDYLATVLQKAGFTISLLDADQLADKEQLNRDQYEVLVLPYGASFPVHAAANFRRFLKSGGKFLSVGGYAFDHLLERTSEGWRPYQPPLPPALDGVAWFCEIPAAELNKRGPLTFRGYLKTRDVAGPGFAHFSVYQIAADGSLPTWRDLCQVRGDQDWQESQFTFAVHPRAQTVSFRAGLYRCRGTAWFDDIEVVDQAGTVLLRGAFEEKPSMTRASRSWWSSHEELCTWQSAVTRSGHGALESKLGFEIPSVERLNTRHGRPEDGLEVAPTQLGVFQADYRLERARSLAAAPMQATIDPAVRCDFPVEGWAACGVVGWNHARWIPLLNAYDSYGRLRGAASAMLRHYAGNWKGSSWAFFGVTNRDLFTPGQPEMTQALVNIVRSLVDDVYFSSMTTEFACYRQGDTAVVSLPIYNGGRKARSLRIALDIYDGAPGVITTAESVNSNSAPHAAPLAHFDFTVRAEPGQTNAVVKSWSIPESVSDFCYLRASLWDGTNEVDRIESGFVVRNADVVRSGPQLKFQENYLRFGDRPLFIFGTDDWAYTFNTQRETPLQWLRDMRQRRDLGVLIYENLQIGLPTSDAHRETFFRQLDGLMQLSQQYGQVYFAGLLIGYNAAAGDADLARQRVYCRDFARRNSETPGLIYYLNGDYRCELSSAVNQHWNDFLQTRYGSDAALRDAWGPNASPKALGDIPAEDYHDWEQSWDDVSAYDRNSFRVSLLRRWNSALISGIREFDTNHPASGEFYQLPHSGVDLPAGIDGLDLANFGFFEKPGADLAKFPALCVYNDQRARGKSGGPGEYGVKTHPAWGDGKDYGYHIARTREQAIDLFLAVPHYALGLGASRIHNWCWKDDAHRVFPWGMVYPCDGVPKDTAYLHRNLSLLFRHFAPVYQPPNVFLLTPDSHRMGGGKWKVIDGILTSIDLLLGTHVKNLGTLNEQWLDIPESAKAIFYPLPFCPTDAACEKLLNWVKEGGVLYVSGDVSYDELRRRTRLTRLEELCGVRFIEERYPNIAVDAASALDQPCVRVEPVDGQVITRAPDGTPLVIHHRVGRGQVILTTDPLELHSVPGRRAKDLALYRQVLELLAGVAPIKVVPDDPRVHVMTLPLVDGGTVWICFNQDESLPCRTVTVEHQLQPVTVTVAQHRPALLWFDGKGALRAVEAQGSCSVGNERVSSDATGGALLTLDARDLRQSRAVLLMPLRSGKVSWTSTADARDMVVETGDISDGKWRPLASQPISRTQDSFAFEVTPDQSLSLLLVCEKEDLNHWRAAIGNAMTNPASLPK